MASTALARLPLSRFALEHAGKVHPIHKTPFIIGRSRESDLVLFSDAVSRQHAALIALGDELVLEDLGSRNGVLVNARRLRGHVELQAGDKLTLGDEPVDVVDFASYSARKERARRDTVRSSSGSSSKRKAPDSSEERLAALEVTAPVDGLELFVSAVDKALLTRRIADAEHLFALHLARPAERAAVSDGPDAAVLETIGLLALRLAEAARSDAWLDFVIRVYSLRSQPMPIAVIGALCTLARKFGGVDRTLLRAYVGALEARSARLLPEEQRAVDRLKGLERLTLRRSRRPPAPQTEG